jgi:hypothetical protein
LPRQQDVASPPSREEVEERAPECSVGDVPRVIPIGIRMPPRSEKHANFRRLAERRTEQVLEAIRILENLSSLNYEFEEPEISKIFSAIERRLEEARARFLRRLTRRDRFAL